MNVPEGFVKDFSEGGLNGEDLLSNP